MAIGFSIVCPHCFLKGNYAISLYSDKDDKIESIPRTILISDLIRSAIDCSKCLMVYPRADYNGIVKVFHKLKKINLSNDDFDSYCTTLVQNSENNFAMRRAAVFFIRDNEKLHNLLISESNPAILENVSLQLHNFSELPIQEHRITCPYCLRNEIFKNKESLNTNLVDVINKNMIFSISSPFKPEESICTQCNKKLHFKFLVGSSYLIEQLLTKNASLAESSKYCFSFIETSLQKHELPRSKAYSENNEDEIDYFDDYLYFYTLSMAFLYIFELNQLETLKRKFYLNQEKLNEQIAFVKNKMSEKKSPNA